MLDVLTDGPFRYLHCRATGELLLTLSKQANGSFVEYEGEDVPVGRSLREWKAIARRRMGDRVITDTHR